MSFISIEPLLQDVRFGIKAMRKTPAITFACLISLALGFGATVALFSLLDSLLLKPLPVPESKQLTVLARMSGGILEDNFPYPAFRRLRESSQTTELFGYSPADATLRLGHALKPVRVATVSGNYFSVLQVTPLFGRLLSAADDRPGSLSAASV